MGNRQIEGNRKEWKNKQKQEWNNHEKKTKSIQHNDTTDEESGREWQIKLKRWNCGGSLEKEREDKIQTNVENGKEEKKKMKKKQEYEKFNQNLKREQEEGKKRDEIKRNFESGKEKNKKENETKYDEWKEWNLTKLAEENESQKM